MKTSRVRLASVGLLTAALVFSACGGDDDDTGGENTAPVTTAAVADESPSTTATGEPGVDEAPAGGVVAITDAQDRTVEVPVNPETVVALDWGVIRTLTSLGVEVDGVPAMSGTAPDDLAPIVESAEQMGTLFEPDYEAIAAMDPDLIVIGGRSGNPEVLAEMERITSTVIDMSVRYENAEDQLPQFRERTLQLASIFDKEAEATAALDEIDADIAATAADAEASGLEAMFVQVSGGVVGAYGPGSRFGLIYDNFGFAPTAAPVDGEGSHGQEISQEFFVAYNPGVIYVLDRGKVVGDEGAPALEVLDNGLVNTTDAATNGKIVEVDGFSWYLATHSIPSMQQIISDVRAGLADS